MGFRFSIAIQKAIYPCQASFDMCNTCVTSDIPATRKVCGFKAELGCNKCLKKFKVGFCQPTDISGYNRDAFINRTNSQHRENVDTVLSKNQNYTNEGRIGTWCLLFCVIRFVLF